MRNIQFTNKETYLAYRSAWKAEYKQLSQTIREQKWMAKEYNRAVNQARSEVDRTWIAFYNRLQEILKANDRYMEYDKKHRLTCPWLYENQKKATAMLAELKEAKRRAQEQYLASKEKELVMA